MNSDESPISAKIEEKIPFSGSNGRVIATLSLKVNCEYFEKSGNINFIELDAICDGETQLITETMLNKSIDKYYQRLSNVSIISMKLKM